MLPILTRRQTCGLLLGATSSIVATNLCDIRPAKAGSILEVTPGSEFKPITIAVTQFAGDAGSQVSSIITNNFNRSVFLQPVNPSAFAGQQINPDAPIQPASWQSLAQYVVTGRSMPSGNGRLQTQFRLWDTSNGQQVAAKQYVTDPNNSRRVAHIISDAIFVQVTGATKGCFDTRVVFVDETGPATHRRKRLAIMDQDGANVRYLTRGDESVVTPRFSPSSQDVTYMAFNNSGAKVLLLNIETGQRESVGNFPGMTFAPRFSPDGQRIIMSLEENGVSNLYTMDIRSRQTTRLSNSNAIDTSPSYSPDGSQIVFNSDRGGSQQIYVMSGSGGDASRISHGQGTYSTPVWSPSGDYIAFTKQVDGQFAIGVMKPDGTGERILTEGFHNEGPTWAPNGLYLMFFRDPGGNSGAHIFMRDVFGRAEFPVPTPSYASDPAWGPLLG